MQAETIRLYILAFLLPEWNLVIALLLGNGGKLFSPRVFFSLVPERHLMNSVSQSDSQLNYIDGHS